MRKRERDGVRVVCCVCVCVRSLSKTWEGAEGQERNLLGNKITYRVYVFPT